MKPNLNTMDKLLKLRSVLQTLSQESFNFSTLNKQYPVSEVDEVEAETLLEMYLDIIIRASKNLNEFETKYGGLYGIPNNK